MSFQGARIVVDNPTGPIISMQSVYNVRFQGEMYFDDPNGVSTTSVIEMYGSTSQAVRFCSFDRITGFGCWQMLDLDTVNECTFNDIHAGGLRNTGMNLHNEVHDNNFPSIFLGAATPLNTSGVVFSSINYSSPTIGGNKFAAITALNFQYGTFVDSGWYELFFGNMLVDSCSTGLVINGNVQRVYVDYLWSSADSNNAIRLNGTAAAPITDVHITKTTVRLSTNSAILMNGCNNCTFGTIDANHNTGQVLVLAGNNTGISVGTLTCDSNASGLISDTGDSSNSNIHINTLVLCRVYWMNGTYQPSASQKSTARHIQCHLLFSS